MASPVGRVHSFSHSSDWHYNYPRKATNFSVCLRPIPFNQLVLLHPFTTLHAEQKQHNFETGWNEKALPAADGKLPSDINKYAI